MAWYTTIDEIADHLIKINYQTDIIVHQHSRTHQILREYAQFNQSLKIFFENAKYLTWNEMLSENMMIELVAGDVFFFMASNKLELFKYGESRLADNMGVDDIKMDKSNDVRLIRREFSHAKQMVKNVSHRP